ncbi:hypothetical protein [Candidatus Marithrix sp. Canyon 246]|uniref:hypothetical protein n=1 Tax=Candidatus Marithrix sp. Canyon 246 TaxID=1827136 RepID=UPI000849F50B|nr:hypothetical protein [Candidatus Marithrix sp. Canyon 246]
MDEDEYQQTRKQLNQCPCPFEKAILSSRCGCEKFQRLNIAEREAAACVSVSAQKQCVELLEQLYQNARFALQQSDINSPLAHAQMMKLQCGGLQGLQSILKQTGNINNINGLVKYIFTNFDDLNKIPYQEVVQFISHYQVRKKRSKKL